MTTLRSKLIRLASDKPELRPVLLPLLTGTKVAYGKLTPRDERVVKMWWDHKPAQGDILYSDGETLVGVWDNVQTPLVRWSGWGTFKMVPTLDSKRRQIQQEIKEMAPGTDSPFAADSDDVAFMARHAMVKQATVRTPLYGHHSMETAYVVDDYPYGSMRTQIRFWLEDNGKKGFRFVSQTLDPKRLRWNTPKPDTYTPLAGGMYLDEKNHVQWTGLGPYSDAKDVVAFLEDFPKADRSRLKVWIPMKVKYYQQALKINGAGLTGWSINNVPERSTDADVERNKTELANWQAALAKL